MVSERVAIHQHTAIGIKEPHVAIFVARDDYALDPRSSHGSAAPCWPAAGGVLFTQALVRLLIQPDGGSHDCIHTRRHGAVVCL